MTNVDKLQKIIDNSDNVVFFGGAGVSTESGIPDFRSDSGIFSYSPEEVLSKTYFENYTKEFFDYYINHLIFDDVEPNMAHYKLAEGESVGKVKCVITQNVDGLHQKAGSRNVLELHGSIYRNFCQFCKKEYDLKKILESDGVPYCECGGVIKPDVVLYEESLNGDVLRDSIKYISEADTLIVGGTSLVVYPAAGLIQYFNGDNLVLINKSTTSYDPFAELVIHDGIGEVFSKINF